MTNNTKGYRMKDLVSLSGVSKQTIHFYLREGLLLPPVNTSKNMAYYDESTVEDIRLIKDLQEKRYLPLTVIKEFLKAKRSGPDLFEDHIILYEHLFGTVSGGVEGRQFNEVSFMAETGLTEHELGQLLEMGIVSNPSEADRRFDEGDFAAAIAIKELMDMGMSLQDMRLYENFLQLSRLEIELVHDRIVHKESEKEHQPLKDIYSNLERVKSLLTAKAYREFFVNHSHE